MKSGARNSNERFCLASHDPSTQASNLYFFTSVSPSLFVCVCMDKVIMLTNMYTWAFQLSTVFVMFLVRLFIVVVRVVASFFFLLDFILLPTWLYVCVYVLMLALISIRHTVFIISIRRRLRRRMTAEQKQKMLRFHWRAHWLAQFICTHMCAIHGEQSFRYISVVWQVMR